MATHIIVGTGWLEEEIPQSVVNESLRDVIEEGDDVVIPWYGKPTPALAQVYDYIFDQEIPFELIHNTGSKIPKAFTDAKFGTVLNPNGGLAAEYLKNLTGVFMVLGDDDITNETLAEVLDKGSWEGPVLDLADGLTEIDLEIVDEPDEVPEAERRGLAEKLVPSDDDPTEVEDEHVAEPDPLSFTRDEMESMPLRTLQRLCKQAGLEASGNAKAAYIDALSEAKGEDVAREAHGVQPLVFDTVEGAFDFLISSLKRINGESPSRPNSIAITKLEEALLWYHYGADIDNFGG